MRLKLGELCFWHGDENEARIPFEGDSPVIISHSNTTRTAAADLLQAIALQLWGNHTAGDVVFTLYEVRPSPLFVHIKRIFAQTQHELGTQIFDGRSFSDYLVGLERLAHKRFGLLANLGVDTLKQYNELPHIRLREKVQYVLVSGLSRDALHNGDLHILESLCNQGAKVGIVLLLLYDVDSSEQRNDNNLGHNSLWSFWQRIIPLGFGFDWENHPPEPVNQDSEYWRLFRRFGFAVGVTDVECNTLVSQIIASVAAGKEASTHSNFLDVPIGYEGNVAVHFQMGEASGIYNALLGGTVGSGKSTIVHNVLLHACEHYTPEQFRLWIVDFSGLGFAIYRDLAHVDFLHTELQVDDSLKDALEQFEQFWAERMETFRNAGVDNIADYNRQGGKNMPRCLLIVDEAHNLFGDRFGNRLIGKIAREGRKFGLHLILITPSFQDLPFDNSVKEQIQLRIGCKLNSEAASRNLFGFDNVAAAHLTNTNDLRMAIVNRDAGRPQANQTVHLNNLTKEERAERLSRLRETYPNPPASPFRRKGINASELNSNNPQASGRDNRPDWLRD